MKKVFIFFLFLSFFGKAQNFYLLTKEEAISIGRFIDEDRNVFDPFVMLQQDGTYALEERLYLHWRRNRRLARVDFSRKTLVPKRNLNTVTRQIQDVIIPDPDILIETRKQLTVVERDSTRR